ncbi:MAG: alpha/beta hydrolase [Deltaproteobacteria bacterium]|nr:alpha/beta hydrolase [Deltaproteobacteria bacterium]
MNSGCELTVRSITDVQTGVPLYLWGGLFGTFLVWSRVARELRKTRPLFLIDFPRYDAANRIFSNDGLDIELLASFQQELMSQMGHSQAILTGWSLGTQVVAESLKYDNIVSAVVISGVLGKPFSHISDPLFETIGIRPRVSQTVGWLTQKEEALSRLRKMVRRNEHPSRWAKRLGLVSPSVDELVMDAAIRDFVNIPAVHYTYYLQIAARHNAAQIVRTSPIPILAVSGNEDKLVPARRSREFVKGDNPNREFLLVRGGTHFVPLEYPELISLKMEDFFKRHQL